MVGTEIRGVKDILLFKDLSKEEISRSLSCSQARLTQYKKNSYIFHQGDVPERMYVLLSGRVLLGQENVLGRQILAEYVEEGQSFGVRDLFLEREEYEYFAQAKVQVQILSISRHFFQQACRRNCEHHSKIIYNMMRMFAAEAEQSTRKTQLLTCGTLEQRIALYLSRLSTRKNAGRVLEIPVNREELAVYLNATRPSLSRELSNMQKKGVLRLIDRRHIRILNNEMLINIIEGEEE